MDTTALAERQLIWLASHFLCAIFGGLLGRRKGRELEGILWGALLGILGLIIIFLRGPTTDLQARRERARLARDGGFQSPQALVDPAVVRALAERQERQKRFLGPAVFVVIMTTLAVSLWGGRGCAPASPETSDEELIRLAGRMKPGDPSGDAPQGAGAPTPARDLSELDPPAVAKGQPWRRDIGGCDASYPDHCIHSPPPDLDCRDIGHRIRVVGSDPHRLDRDHDGWACE